MRKWAPDAETIGSGIEQAKLALICVNARSLIGDDYLAAPAQPESTDRFNEVLRTSVAIRSPNLSAAKVRNRRRTRRRDRIPRNAPAADDIERLEAPGKIVWFVVGSRRRRNQTNPIRFTCNHSENHRRFEPIKRRLVRDVGTYRGGVGEEYSIHQTMLRNLRSADVVLDVEKGAWIRARPAPCGGMTTGTMKI